MLKKLTKRLLPLLLSLVVVLGTVFSDYEKVTATGISEIMYYTYWDLINTIYATCGYEMSVSDAEINNHGVTGKQAWDNFCTAVEGTAKFHGKLFKGAMSEMYDLAKNATQKGISMSQDLFDMLKDALATHAEECSASYTGLISSVDSAKSIIASVCGTSVEAVPDYDLLGERYLYIYKHEGNIYIFTDVYNRILSFGSGSFLNSNGNRVGRFNGIEFEVSTGQYTADRKCYSDKDDVWLVRHTYMFTDKSITARVAQGACPKEVPESIPWRKEKSIPDGWRVVPQEVPDTGTDTDPGKEPEKEPDKKPDKKPKENPDILPVEIPLLPFSPSVPDTKPLETPDKDPDKEPAKDPDKEPAKDPDKEPEKQPGVLVNPLTGNFIDPVTGYDIDPKTGLLIDPETGELIDPKNLPDSDDDSGGGGGGSGGLPGAVSGFGDITKLFPFCIPFDIIRLIQGMKAQEAPPVFHFEYHFDSINYTFSFDVDLSDYAKYIKIFRFGMQIFYALALMFLTLKVSKIFI